jgi:flagellar basal body rod protein FlgG
MKEGEKVKAKIRYRIQRADGRIKYAGTGQDSWFTLDRARELVDRDTGERIIESDGVNVLWEVF